MYLLELFTGLILLIVGGHWLIRSTGRLAVALKVPTLVISLVLIAYGSSSPEIAVSLSAALKGANEIVIGNVVGSNIINIALILGIGALILPLKAHLTLLKREAPLLLGLTALMVIALLDGKLERWEGILGLTSGIAYTGYLVYSALRERRSRFANPEEVVGKVRKRDRWWAQLAIGIVSLAVMIYGAELFVRGAITLSELLGASPLIIGITVVAIGTSLPELVTTVIAAYKKEHDIAISNIMGSNIFNILIVLGVTATIRPVRLSGSSDMLWVDLLVMLGITLLFVIAITRKGNQISRPIAVIFLGMYLLYTGYLIW